MGQGIFDLGEKLNYESPFENWLSPLSSEVSGKENSDIQVTRIEGPSIVCEGAVYEFKIISYNQASSTIDFNKVADKISWAYQVDEGSLSKINQRSEVDRSRNNVVLKWKIPKLNGGKNLKVYVWTSRPNTAISTSSAILTYPFYFDRYKTKGLNVTGTGIADDMCYGDGITKTDHFRYSLEDIELLGDLMKNTLNQSNESLWNDLQSMVTGLFSVGDLENVAIEMLTKFKENKGGEYSSKVLEKYVVEHESTVKFCNNLEKGMKGLLYSYEGNPVSLENSSVNLSSQKYGRPIFNKSSDKFLGGLTICMNDTWSYEVFINNYDSNDGKNYKIKYNVILYDHFGLDKSDVELKDHPYYILAGFRAWFVLQHARNFKPFITKVEFEKTFTGNTSETGELNVIKEK